MGTVNIDVLCNLITDKADEVIEFVDDKSANKVAYKGLDLVYEAEQYAEADSTVPTALYIKLLRTNDELDVILNGVDVFLD